MLVVMGERGMFPAAVSGALGRRAWSRCGTPARWTSRFASQRSCDRRGLRVETYPEADKLGKQFKYASSRGIPFVAIIGDEELANGTVAVKNMTSGEQVSVPCAAAQDILRRLRT